MCVKGAIGPPLDFPSRIWAQASHNFMGFTHVSSPLALQLVHAWNTCEIIFVVCFFLLGTPSRRSYVSKSNNQTFSLLNLTAFPVRIKQVSENVSITWQKSISLQNGVESCLAMRESSIDTFLLQCSLLSLSTLGWNWGPAQNNLTCILSSVRKFVFVFAIQHLCMPHRLPEQ